MRHFKIKNIFSYVVVAALVAALSISCKSNEEPKDNTHSNHPPSGEYKGTVGSTTVTATVTTSGEATVAAPTGYTLFTVDYNGNTIRVGFQVDGTWYSTYDMVRQ